MDSLLDEYAEWVEKDIPLNSDWDEELNYIAHLREELHHIGVKDTQRLRKLDLRLQNNILTNPTSDQNYQFTYPRDGLPKEAWWAWLDLLPILTKDQKQTL